MPQIPRHAVSPLRTKYGTFDLHVFSWSENEQDNLLTLVSEWQGTPLVRIQSTCYTGEIFGSLDCDCHWQLETSLAKIADGGGLFIYQLQDGRGAGLLTKIAGMNLTWNEGLDTAEAYKKLGVQPDPRDYSRPAHILSHFGVNNVRLLTNNPRKVAGLERYGLSVERISLESEPTEFNRDYLRAKAQKLGHMMRHFEESSKTACNEAVQQSVDNTEKNT